MYTRWSDWMIRTSGRSWCRRDGRGRGSLRGRRRRPSLPKSTSRYSDDLTENLVCCDLYVWQLLYAQPFASLHNPGFGIAIGSGVAIAGNRFIVQINQPCLNDALVRIAGKLHVAIALERTVRDLDDERDIARCRHPLTVESARSPQQRNVRLRLPESIEDNGVLSADPHFLRREMGVSTQNPVVLDRLWEPPPDIEC